MQRGLNQLRHAFHKHFLYLPSIVLNAGGKVMPDTVNYLQVPRASRKKKSFLIYLKQMSYSKILIYLLLVVFFFYPFLNGSRYFHLFLSTVMTPSAQLSELGKVIVSKISLKK